VTTVPSPPRKLQDDGTAVEVDEAEAAAEVAVAPTPLVEEATGIKKPESEPPFGVSLVTSV
jgi:hypothetical protein